MIHDWINILLVGLGLFGGSVFTLYSIFETKDASKERAALIINRLDRIEDKLDAVIERRR